MAKQLRPLRNYPNTAWTNLRFDDLPPSPSKLHFYSKLSAPHRKFVDEFIVSHDPQASALRAGFNNGRTAYHHLLADQRIRCAIRERMDVITEMASITAADVRRELKLTYEADPTEISGVWRVPCRHCWGENNRFQYTEPEMYYIEQAHSYGENNWPQACITGEFGLAIKAHAIAAYNAGKKSLDIDIKGGGGYSRIREINSDCPQCHGIGEAMAYICDTRYMSDGAKKLFKGVKITSQGLEVITLDKQNVLNILARDTQVGVERRELTINLPRTQQEFEEVIEKMSTEELEVFVANMVTLAESEYSEVEEAGDVEASLPPPNKFRRGR
jgi:phage terminase small subunit